MQTNFFTVRRVSEAELTPRAGHPSAMLTEIYIVALLVDEGLADRVRELWDCEVIDDAIAVGLWWSTAHSANIEQKSKSTD